MTFVTFCDNFDEIKQRFEDKSIVIGRSKAEFWDERRNCMAATAKGCMYSSSFDSVFVDISHVSFAIPKMSAYNFIDSV